MKYLMTLFSLLLVLLSIVVYTDVSILLLILLSYSLLLFRLVISLFLCLFLVKFFLFTFKRFYSLLHSSTWSFVKLHWFFVYFMCSFIIIQDTLNKGCIREFNVSDQISLGHMHTVYNKSLFNCIFTYHFMESIVKFKDSLRIRLKLKTIVETILENKRVLRGHGIIRLSRIFLNV